jgi:hypothetical protein
MQKKKENRAENSRRTGFFFNHLCRGAIFDLKSSACKGMEELEASVFIPFKHLLKAPSRKAVEEMFAAAYKARHVHPPPPKLVEATAAALQIEAPEALKVPLPIFIFSHLFHNKRNKIKINKK